MEFSRGNASYDEVQHQEEDLIYHHILELTVPHTREQALLELSKKREAYEDLAPILWHSFGIYA